MPIFGAMSDEKNMSRKDLIIWLALIILALSIKLLSLDKTWVESTYYQSVYPRIGATLRLLFGWIPFSLGDILYGLAAIWIAVKLFALIKKVYRKQLNRQKLLSISLKITQTSLIIYIIFYGFWGINYTRKGIAYQLGLEVKEFSKSDLILLDSLLMEKVNSYKQEANKTGINNMSYQDIFNEAYHSYDNARGDHPYFKYDHRSAKPVFMSGAVSYLGFLGHYNPFTGEAQVNTDIPNFLLPFTTCHEIAHQLGYAKEYEANFAGFIAAQHSVNPYFLYSSYLDMYLYTNGELFRADSISAKTSRDKFSEAVKKDMKEWSNYRKEHETFIEPLTEKFYATFLKLNEQPAGIRSYNRVVLWLVAYYKKTGRI